MWFVLIRKRGEELVKFSIFRYRIFIFKRARSAIEGNNRAFEYFEDERKFHSATRTFVPTSIRRRYYI